MASGRSPRSTPTAPGTPARIRTTTSRSCGCRTRPTGRRSRTSPARETLATDAPAGQSVEVIGYPDGAAEPVWCSGLVKGFSATQYEFDCGGYPNGTSGGPFLTGVNAATGQGAVIGVIGGYQQGGDTPQVSYAAVFGSAVSQLYATAEAGG